MNRVIRSSCKLTENTNIFGAIKRCLSTQYSSKGLHNFQCSRSKLLCTKPVSVWNNLQKNHYSAETNEVAVQLQQFLEQEIAAEEEQQGRKTIPSKIDDFEVKLDGSNVSLVKQSGDETIKLSLNVNHSVDVDEGDEQYRLKAMPTFNIEITKGSTTLGFSCSYVEESSEERDVEVDENAEPDLFAIDDMTIYTGEYTEKTYSVSTNILDTNLYHILMNLLETKGITNEFVDKVSELSTMYEQSLYVSLLRGMKKFVA